MAEPDSKAIYFYLVFIVSDCIDGFIPSRGAVFNILVSAYEVVVCICSLAGIFVFRSEMVRHFTETEPRGIELGGVMTFFFNLLYFQYWFHEICREQNEVDVSLTQ